MELHSGAYIAIGTSTTTIARRICWYSPAVYMLLVLFDRACWPTCKPWQWVPEFYHSPPEGIDSPSLIFGMYMYSLPYYTWGNIEIESGKLYKYMRKGTSQFCFISLISLLFWPFLYMGHVNSMRWGAVIHCRITWTRSGFRRRTIGPGPRTGSPCTSWVFKKMKIKISTCEFRVIH